MATCALCKSDKLLKESHIIPKFVFERIKENSPTGFLRGGFLNPNQRKQDGDKPKMLCEVCEQKFSQAEKEFAENIFKPYHELGKTSFSYGSWLSYFISSVNWRTLYLDNIDFHSKKECSADVLCVLDNAETILADFLLGKRPNIGDMENHILPLFEITGASSDLKDIEPNFLFRISAFGYTFLVPGLDGFYVFANLAGVLIFTVIRKGKNDVWDNTLVQTGDGVIEQPPVQHKSPLMADIMERLIECSKVKISQTQKDKIIESLKANSQAFRSKAVEIRELDKKLRDGTIC
ncbi:MAG: hypothetical protein WAV28_20010 [Sedimentisphaerales bacterium]